MNLDPATKEQVHTLWFQIHASLAYALYALLALHVLGALKHQFIDKEGEFGRILPWGRADAATPTLLPRPVLEVGRQRRQRSRLLRDIPPRVVAKVDPRTGRQRQGSGNGAERGA